MKTPEQLFKAAKRRASISYRKRKVIGKGVTFLPPNYLYFDAFDASSIVIDAGCGSDAELSRHLIDTYGLTAFGVDPTRKHRPALNALAAQYDGRFVYLDHAVGAAAGTVVFHESRENESGSMLAGHGNVLRDTLSSYEVEVLSPAGLMERAGTARVDYLKLDLEGAEYELVHTMNPSEWQGVRQLFLEFHHHCIRDFSRDDTLACVKTIESSGFSSITIDDANYLFFKPS